MRGLGGEKDTTPFPSISSISPALSATILERRRGRQSPRRGWRQISSCSPPARLRGTGWNRSAEFIVRSGFQDGVGSVERLGVSALVSSSKLMPNPAPEWLWPLEPPISRRSQCRRRSGHRSRHPGSGRPSRRGSRLSSPGVDRVIREPYRQVAAPAQRGVILSPVRDTVGEIDDQA